MTLFFLLPLSLQEAVAQRSFWRQLRERGPDAAQRLLPPPDVGPDGHHRPGGLPPGPQPDLLQAAGAQRGDPRHDPARPGLPGGHHLPPRLQRLRDQPLTGAEEPPSPTISTPSTAAHPSQAAASCRPRQRAPAAAHVASATACAPAATPPGHLGHRPIPPGAKPDEPLLDFPKPPNLFSSHRCAMRPDPTAPCTREPRRSRLADNLRHPFRVHAPSHRHLPSVTPGNLQTVASEPTLLAPLPPRGSHLPHLPRSPYEGADGSVLTRGPAPSHPSHVPPPPPPARPTGPGQPTAWGCCCTLAGAAAPLSRYLGKVGHATLPLLKAGGLLNAEPSDVQT